MDYKLLPRHQMTFDGRLRLARLRELAEDSRPARAPIIGIPIVLVDGTRFCIKVRRDLLESAVALAESAYWDAEANRLVLNGGKRSCWKLISMQESHASNGILGSLSSWAESQRNRVVAKSSTPGQRKAKRIEHEIGVLERKRDKIHARRPVNPICQAPRECGDWGRETELAWAKGKHTRRELSRVFTIPALHAIQHAFRPDWKALYAEAAKTLGMERISEHNRHPRVTRLTNAPTLVSYVKHPERYLARMDKPYTRGKAERWGQESTESEVESMWRYRKEYLEEMSIIRALNQSIENLNEVKRATLEAEVKP
jgi:hypothetical protein